MGYIANYTFTNLHENVTFTVERFYEVLNRDANGMMPRDFLTKWNCGIVNIKAVLKDAIQDNKKVRVLGGGWSLSDVQQTTDYFINLNALNMIHVGLPEEDLSNGVSDGNYCLSQCGASVMEINEQLRQSNLALSTTGASDGQSIVGAFTTGTHGAAIGFGSMSDFIEGLHIIVSDTLHYWLEGSEPIVSDLFIQNYTPGAIRINDDNILNSTVVSFGSFGVIHAVLIKAEPLYELARYQKYVDWTLVQNSMDGPTNIATLGLPTKDLYNFTVISNPYKLQSMVVCAMLKIPYTSSTPPIHNPGFGPSNDVLSLIGGIGAIAPNSISAIMGAMDKMIKKRYPECSGDANIPGWFFADGTTAGEGKALSVELAIDAATIVKAANIIFDLVKNTPFPGVIAFRYIKQTKATLGFTKYPISCAVEFPAVYSKETQNFYNALYHALDVAGIEYTFHWGQCNNLNDVNVREKYGETVIERWLNARYSLLKTHQQQLMFSNNFMQRLKLDILSDTDPFVIDHKPATV